jgi:predicted Holliday junction resolvase-like endonuclease
MTELSQEFQEFRKILCICPCCGEIVRVSDLKLYAKGKATKTWLDEYDHKQQLLDIKEEKFNEKEEKLRENARNKGREQAEKAFNKAILPSFKALKLDPYDVKPILNPIDFIVFQGMNKQDEITNIIFLSKEHDAPTLTTTRKQIKDAINEKRYEWQVARIEETGKIKFE